MKPEPRGLAALAAQVGQYRLVFRWPERRPSLLVPALLVLAVAIHALAFYVFQVVYPPAATSAPPRAQVTLLTPGSPQNDALLKWVQVQDPATAAKIQEITPSGLCEVRYVPSFQNINTQPREVEIPATPTQWPPAHNLLDFRESREPVSNNAFRFGVASSISFSEALRMRERGTTALAQPLAITVKSSANNLKPAVFLLGIGDRGDVRYCFLQESSSDREMDKQAEALLRQRDFSHSATALEWGFATFNWGSEAYAPPSPQPTPQIAVPGT